MLKKKKKKTATIGGPYILQGILKENMYEYVGQEEDISKIVAMTTCGNISFSDKKEFLSNIDNCFKLTCPAGTIFLCYLDKNEEQCWDNKEYGFENESDDWAIDYLIDIKKITEKK